METTLRATVRYDGTDFAGWQRQPGRRTVQGEIEAALSRIGGRPAAIQGAGRTDAGVHALGQVFSCVWPGPAPAGLRRSLSRMLRPEIRVLSVTEAAPGFNARFSAIGKTYAYALDLSREADPFLRRYAWHVPYRMDLDLLAGAAEDLCGERDFAGFQSAGSQMERTVRTVHAIRLERGGFCGGPPDAPVWRLVFEGDGFLYKMVRNITGTLVEVARGRYPREALGAMLAGGAPFRGHCAPAHGLALVEVRYADGEA